MLVQTMYKFLKAKLATDSTLVSICLTAAVVFSLTGSSNAEENLCLQNNCTETSGKNDSDTILLPVGVLMSFT